MWDELGTKGKDFYNEIRRQFNETGDPCQFFFLLRTCRIGTIRFNRKGRLHDVPSLRQAGVHPEKVKAVLDDWHGRLQGRDVQFAVRDYR